MYICRIEVTPVDEVISSTRNVVQVISSMWGWGCRSYNVRQKMLSKLWLCQPV